MFKLNQQYRYKKTSIKRNIAYHFGRTVKHPAFGRLAVLLVSIAVIGGIFVFSPSGADASNTHPVLTQQGYVFENDDAAADGQTSMAGSAFSSGKTLTEVRQGERVNLRTQITNSGTAINPTDELALFYDRNDGIWTKVQNQAVPSTASGSGCGAGASSLFVCEQVFDGENDLEGRNTTIVTDPTGNVWMSFFGLETGANNDGSAYVARYVGSGGNCDELDGAGGSDAWNCEIVYAGNSTADSVKSRLTFADDGTPWLSTKNNATNSQLIVAEYLGDGTGNCATVGDAQGSSNWNCTAVYTGRDNNTGNHNDIVIDGSGTPWAYVNDQAASDGKAVVAKYVGGGSGDCHTVGGAGGSSDWDCTIVYDGNGTFDGENGRLFRDSDGGVVLTFKDADITELILAKYVGGASGDCANEGDVGGSNDWDCTRVYDALAGDSTDLFPQAAFYALAPDGNPWLVFREASSGNDKVIVARYVGTSGQDCDSVGGPNGSDLWDCEIVFDSSNSLTGSETSIAFAPDGNPWIQFGVGSTNDGGIYTAQYIGNGNGNCNSVGDSGGSNNWTCYRAYDGANTEDGEMGSITFDNLGNLWLSFFVDTPNDGQVWVAKIPRAGEIRLAPSVNMADGDVLAESHADMTSPTDVTGRDDADCLAGSTTWNNGVYFNAENGTGLSLPAGNSTKQCTEITWTLDTSQATLGTTYRFVIALKDSFKATKGVWRGPTSVAADGYPVLTISASEKSTYRYSKDILTAFDSACTASNWGCTVVDAQTDGVGSDASLAFGANGDAWISYQNINDNSLVVAHYVGSGGNCDTYAAGSAGSDAWQCTVVDDQTAAVGQETSLTIDSTGFPWVAYRGASDSVAVAHYVGSGGNCDTYAAGSAGSDAWQCTIIDNQTDLLNVTGSIALNHSDNPWLSYNNTNDGSLVVAHYVGSGGNCDTYAAGSTGSDAWQCVVVDDQTDAVGTNSYLSIDNDGTAWISYENTADSSLLVARWIGSHGNCDTYAGGSLGSDSWQCTVVDDQTDTVGSFNTISIDAAGVPWISYRGGSFSATVAHYVGSGGNCDTYAAGSTGSDAWQCTVVDDQTDTVGDFTSVALDSSGQPWLSYANSTDGALIVANFVGSGGNCDTYAAGSTGSDAWQCTVVDDPANAVGVYSSIAFDASGVPWVSHRDFNAGSLLVSKLILPPSPLSRQTLNSMSHRNANTGDMRYLLSSGLAPYTDSYGTCGANSDLAGYCGLFHPEGYRDSITAGIGQRPIYGFSTRYDANTYLPTANLYFQTDVSPATANVVLQVYRYGTTNNWETVSTYSNAGCASDNCLIRALPAGTASEYFQDDGGGWWVHFRVYQSQAASAITFSIDSFTSKVTPVKLRGGRVFREQVSNPFGW